MDHKRVSKFKTKTIYKFNKGIKTPYYFMVAKYIDLITGSIDAVQLQEFAIMEEAEQACIEKNKLEPLIKEAESAREYFNEKIYSRFNAQYLKNKIDDIDDAVMVELVNVLRSDDYAMNRAAEKIKAFSITEEVKNSVKNLGRNEQKLIVNSYVAQSILVSIVDFLNDMPERKRQSAKPSVDLLVNVGDLLDELNALFAYQMQDSLSQSQYNTMIVESLRLVNIMSGKWDKCNTCVFSDEQKKIVKKELRETIAGKGAL